MCAKGSMKNGERMTKETMRRMILLLLKAESNTNNEEEAAALPQRFDDSDRLIGRSDDRIWLQLSHTVYLAL